MQRIQCCDSHVAQKCFDNDVYWLDSCNKREEKKEECGSDECTGYGSWQCKDSATKQKTRACYTKGCDAAKNACYSNSFSDAEEETCAYGTQCENGECRTYTPDTTYDYGGGGGGGSGPGLEKD